MQSVPDAGEIGDTLSYRLGVTRTVPYPQFDGRTLRRMRLAPGHVRISDIARGAPPRR